MAEVVWNDEAVAELREIVPCIKDFDQSAARRMGDRPLLLGASSSDFPNRGHPAGGKVRALVTSSPCILRCRVADDRVLIISMRHGARRPD